MPDSIPSPVAPQIPPTDQHTGTQETGGQVFQSPHAPGELPLTQAGQDAGQMPTNVPAADPLQPDKAPQSGYDAQAQPVGQGNPVATDQREQPGMVQDQPRDQPPGEVAGQQRVDPGSAHKQGPNPKDEGEQAEGDGEEQHPDEFDKDPNDKDQPQSQPAQKSVPPLPDSLRQIPHKLKTNRDFTHGQDPALNKYRT